MEELKDKLVQALIVKALEDNPNGLTERQIIKYVKQKMNEFQDIIEIMFWLEEKK